MRPQIITGKANSALSLWILIVILLWFGIELSLHFPGNVLSWDVFGAYLHLPANFIYRDPFLRDWSWIESINEIYNSTPTFYQFWQAETGNQVIKYPLGFSVVYLPFFLIGHNVAYFLDFPVDGFSKPYQWAIVFGHVFYIVAGLILIRKVLLSFFADKIVGLLLIILFAGTNFFFTSTSMVAMPHGHLFFFYALILWFTIKWHEQPTWTASIGLALSLGFAALIRATEIVAILIPLMWLIHDNRTKLKKWDFLKNERKKVLVMFIIYALIGSIQLIYFKLSAGQIFVDAYNNAGEGFDFFRPYTWDFLLSFRKGWLIYTPIMIFAVIGFLPMWKKNRNIALAISAFTLINVYLLSSWTCWWYAESFGQRSMVQSYALLLIPLGYFIESVQQKSILQRSVTGFIISSFIILNLFQTYQLHKGLLHPSRMTMSAYFEHFLTLKRSPNFEELLLVNKDFPVEEVILNKNLKPRFISRSIFQNNQWNTIQKNDNHILSGFNLTDSSIFSPEIVLPYKEITEAHQSILKISAMIYFDGDINEIEPTLVSKMKHGKKPYYDQYLKIEKIDSLTPNTWHQVTYSFYSTDVRNPKKDQFQIFGWLRGKGSFRIDDVQLWVYEGLK